MIQVFLMTWSLCTFGGPMCLMDFIPFDTYAECEEFQKDRDVDVYFSGCAVMSSGAEEDLRMFQSAPTINDWKVVK